MTLPPASIKWPLLLIAIPYAGGILLANLFPLPLAGLWWSMVLVLLLWLLKGRTRPFLLAFLLLLVGAANLTLRTDILSPNDLRSLIGERSEDVLLRGQLIDTPSPKMVLRNAHVSWRNMAMIEVSSIRFQRDETGWRPAVGRVAVRTPDELSPTFCGGREVQVEGVLHVPKGALAEGMFDYREYLRRLGIHYQLTVLSTNSWKLRDPDQPGPTPLTDGFVRWGRAALAKGLPVEDESLRLEWALTLGWKPALTEQVSEPFIQAATYHIFAVDGLRIMILSAIFVVLFRVLNLSRATAGALVIPVLWFYAWMTGFPASAIRATVMATIVMLGWVLHRPTHLINSLFAAALIILVWEPSQLFQAGFQLSFCVVLCILLLMPILEKLRLSIFSPDPFLPATPLPLWKQVLSKAALYTWNTFAVSLVPWLGSIPLVALYFHVLTPVSGPANLLAVPLCGVALFCNIISLLLAGWFPWAAEYYNHAGWFIMECIRAPTRGFAHWPAGYFFISAPGFATIAIYYLVLLTLGTPWLFKLQKRAWALSALALAVCVWGLLELVESRVTRLTILPLRSSVATLVDAPGTANDLLINCGDEGSADFVLKPFLQAQGINHLRRLVLTHGETHHVGGFDMVRENFKPAEIDISAVRFRSPAYRQILQKVQPSPGLAKTVQREDHLGSWQVLHPCRQDRFPQADDNALVLFREIDGVRVLLLSDLGRPGQNALFTRQPALRADIVVAGLPKRGEPLAEAVLDALQSKLIIIADSDNPAAARAREPLRRRLRRRGVPTLYTSETGAVTLLFDDKGWRVSTMNPPEADTDSDGY